MRFALVTPTIETAIGRHAARRLLEELPPRSIVDRPDPR
jgi:hypothetical protein